MTSIAAFYIANWEHSESDNDTSDDIDTDANTCNTESDYSCSFQTKFETMEHEYYRNCRILKQFSPKKRSRLNKKQKVLFKPPFGWNKLKQPFWSCKRYKNQLLLYGYIRQISSTYHPPDISELISKYYTQYQVSFNETIICYKEEDDYEEEDITEFKSINIIKSTNISIQPLKDKQRQIDIAPTVDQWCDQSIVHYKKKCKLQYEFVIECKDNMMNGDILIGIRSIDENCSEYISYVMRCVPFMGPPNTHTFQFYYMLQDNYLRSQTTVCICKRTFSPKYDRISLILQRSYIWQLFFAFNDEIIHSVKVTPNQSYVPLVSRCRQLIYQYRSVRDTEDLTIKYKVISMRCYLNREDKNCKYIITKDKMRYVYEISDFGYESLAEQQMIRTSDDVIDLLWQGYRLLWFDERKLSRYAYYGPITTVCKNTFFIRKKVRVLLEIYQCFWEEYISTIRDVLRNKNGFGRDFVDWYTNEKGYWFRIGAIITEYVIEDYRKDYNYYQECEPWLGDSIRYLLIDGFDLYKLWEHCFTCSWESFEINKAMEVKLQQEQELAELEYNEELVELAYDYTWDKNKFLSHKINKKYLNKKKKCREKKRKQKECIRSDIALQKNALGIIQFLIGIFKRDQHKYPWNTFLNNEFYGYLNIESDSDD